MRNPFRKKTLMNTPIEEYSFDDLTNKSFHLRCEITEKMKQLAHILACLDQCSDMVTVEKKVSKDLLGVVPQFADERIEF